MRTLSSGRALLAGLSALLVLGGLGADGPAGCAAPPPLRATLVHQGLRSPMGLAAPRGDRRLFVLERRGTIQILENGVPRPAPFLDLSTKVSATGEGGLLGLAFPADYATSRHFYVYYTACDGKASGGRTCRLNGQDGLFRSVVSRFRTSADPDVADPASEQELLSVGQPEFNHDGGSLHFSPTNGFLYAAFGDGGFAYDPYEVGQNTASLLGKMLRIDVSGGGAYAIPPSNPFANVAGHAPEIWALGLRNPFRWSFDRKTGDLWIGDVGQDQLEEIDFEPASSPGGRNYGWDVMEGTSCNPVEPAFFPPCNSPLFTPPVHQYAHDLVGNDVRCAVVGGSVYRGVVPEIAGAYLFGDYCTGEVFALDPATKAVTPLSGVLAAARRTYEMTSLSEDGFGELYVTHLGTQISDGSFTGAIYRIGSSLPDTDADGVPDHADNCVSAPNGPLLPDAGGQVQLDTDGDGFGNRCDPDLNGDGMVNFADLAALRLQFFQAGGPADLDGSGVVNFGDLALLRLGFFQAPGPSGVTP